MAIKVNGITVIDDDKSIYNIQNIYSQKATFTGTEAIKLPSGSSSQRPSSLSGLLRYNTDNKNLEYSTNADWAPVGGGSAAKIYYLANS